MKCNVVNSSAFRLIRASANIWAVNAALSSAAHVNAQFTTLTNLHDQYADEKALSPGLISQMLWLLPRCSIFPLWTKPVWLFRTIKNDKMLTSYLFRYYTMSRDQVLASYSLIRGVDDSLARPHITFQKDLEESECTIEYGFEQDLADHEL